MNIQISNLPKGIFQATLEDLFKKFGVVTTVVFHYDNLGMAVRANVLMEQGGEKAIETLNGYLLDNKRLKVQENSGDQEKWGDMESESEHITKN
jgi:RNA recognition motif-containing protein